jgi:N-dimethylarginine dimethylaminohydrolase
LVEAGPLIDRTLANAHMTGAKFDLQLAMPQHTEMVRIYESNGVTCHYLDADPVLHRNFFARDSSAMTPWGALICHMQLKVRRADYVTAIRFYQEKNIPIWNYATAGHFEGGDFVILEPGKVLIGYCGERSEKAGSEQVATFVRNEGWEAVTAPISREFVHMDGLVVPLAEKLLLACLDALEPWVVTQLRDWGFDFVDVP